MSPNQSKYIKIDNFQGFKTKPKINSYNVNQVIQQSSKRGVSDINVIPKLDNNKSFRRQINLPLDTTDENMVVDDDC